MIFCYSHKFQGIRNQMNNFYIVYNLIAESLLLPSPRSPSSQYTYVYCDSVRLSLAYVESTHSDDMHLLNRFCTGSGTLSTLLKPPLPRHELHTHYAIANFKNTVLNNRNSNNNDGCWWQPMTEKRERGGTSARDRDLLQKRFSFTVNKTINIGIDL